MTQIDENEQLGKDKKSNTLQHMMNRQALIHFKVDMNALKWRYITGDGITTLWQPDFYLLSFNRWYCKVLPIFLEPKFNDLVKNKERCDGKTKKK